MMAVMASACHNDEPEPEPVPDPVPTRTVIVYMVANNNLGQGLSRYDRLDLEEMAAAATAGAIPEDCHLIVYHAPYHSDPVLKEITAEGTRELKVYKGSYTQGYSLTPERFQEVFADVESLAPADSYGLVLWSHGTGWVETNDSRSLSAPDDLDSRLIQPLSFGVDGDYEMKVTSLAKALEGRTFDFLYFDCCLMGSVEVAYELRNAAPVIVASPTELQVFGQRYDWNIPVFFAENADMVAAARNTFNFYNDMTDGVAQACTMVTIDTQALPELADATRAIMATGAVSATDYSPIKFYNSYGGKAIVDMADYITSLPGVDESLIAQWLVAYQKVQLYSAATPTYGRYNLAGYRGLASAIVESRDAAERYGYENQAWYRDVVSHNPALAE